jgi:hypothetical protein
MEVAAAAAVVPAEDAVEEEMVVEAAVVAVGAEDAVEEEMANVVGNGGYNEKKYYLFKF